MALLLYRQRAKKGKQLQNTSSEKRNGKKKKKPVPVIVSVQLLEVVP